MVSSITGELRLGRAQLGFEGGDMAALPAQLAPAPGCRDPDRQLASQKTHERPAESNQVKRCFDEERQGP